MYETHNNGMVEKEEVFDVIGTVFLYKLYVECEGRTTKSSNKGN